GRAGSLKCHPIKIHLSRIIDPITSVPSVITSQKQPFSDQCEVQPQLFILLFFYCLFYALTGVLDLNNYLFQLYEGPTISHNLLFMSRGYTKKFWHEEITQQDGLIPEPN